MDNTSTLAFVFDNCVALKQREMYEAALLDAYSGTRTNLVRWKLAVLRFLFGLADKSKLRALSSPIPHGELILYRGVSGTGRNRRPTGPSWTSRIEVAAWFANSAHYGDPAIHTVTIDSDQALAHIVDRHEAEFIYFAKGNPKRMRLTNGDLVEMAQIHISEVRVRDEQLRATHGSL